MLATRRRLTWSHHRRLVQVESQDRLRFYERLADDQRLSVAQVAEASRAAATSQALAVPADAPLDLALRARFGPPAEANCSRPSPARRSGRRPAATLL